MAYLNPLLSQVDDSYISDLEEAQINLKRKGRRSFNKNRRIRRSDQMLEALIEARNTLRNNNQSMFADSVLSSIKLLKVVFHW